MGIDQIKEPLNQFFASVSKTVKVDKMIVFGSYSKGTATEDSDIDVVVVSNDFKKIREDKWLDIVDALRAT